MFFSFMYHLQLFRVGFDLNFFKKLNIITKVPTFVCLLIANIFFFIELEVNLVSVPLR